MRFSIETESITIQNTENPPELNLRLVDFLCP